tara:strand:- start:1913 stop:2563 length:651 start_codon:yes stop_codon:yes gene_type:complete
MSIKLNAQSGGSVALDAPTQTTGSADVTFTLPVDAGSNGQVIQTNGSGVLSYTSKGKLVGHGITYKTSQAYADVIFPNRTPDLIYLDYAAQNSNNKLLIMANLHISNENSNRTYGELYIGGSLATGALADAAGNRSRAAFLMQPNDDNNKIIQMHHQYIHGGNGTTSTSTTRYSYRFFHENSSNSRYILLNRSWNDSDNQLDARAASSIVILEFEP